MRNSAETKQQKRVPIIMKFDRDKLLQREALNDKRGSISSTNRQKKRISSKQMALHKERVLTEASPYRKKAVLTKIQPKKQLKPTLNPVENELTTSFPK